MVWAPDSGSAPAAPHGPEQLPDLGERLPASALDQRRGLDRALRVLLEHLPRARGLDHHHAEVVREHVVQLAGDPAALERYGRRSSSSCACCARSAFSDSSRASRVWLRIVRPQATERSRRT